MITGILLITVSKLYESPLVNQSNEAVGAVLLGVVQRRGSPPVQSRIVALGPGRHERQPQPVAADVDGLDPALLNTLPERLELEPRHAPRAPTLRRGRRPMSATCKYAGTRAPTSTKAACAWTRSRPRPLISRPHYKMTRALPSHPIGSTCSIDRDSTRFAASAPLTHTSISGRPVAYPAESDTKSVSLMSRQCTKPSTSAPIDTQAQQGARLRTTPSHWPAVAFSSSASSLRAGRPAGAGARSSRAARRASR